MRPHPETYQDHTHKHQDTSTLIHSIQVEQLRAEKTTSKQEMDMLRHQVD